MKTGLLVLLLVVTWAVHVYHLGTLRHPPIERRDGEATFFDKREYGVHQLVVSGSPFGRGLKGGRLTSKLIAQEERELTSQLFRFVPEPLFVLLEIPLIEIFSGAERYVEPWMLEEMYGISKSASPEFNRLADGLTRQLAYHGLHEVGQMMVDQMGDEIGCTVVAYPIGSKWVLGRNFDFEGGRTLDREKLVKWIFPDDGYAFVSVIWAGMVGAVTAVNENGLYLSLNAAGSADRALSGTPSTLVLAKVMMRAKTAGQAIAILESEKMFITDIFVLLDSKSGELYRIEKSPAHTEVIQMNGPSAVTNHLVSERFANDPVNQFRMNALTTVARQKRAEEILRDERFKRARSTNELHRLILNVLRDKGGFALGNRQAIDPLIAVHSVIFDSDKRILFVSEGPSLAGRFFGFDLAASFRDRRPIPAGVLPRDPLVSDERYETVHSARLLLQSAEHELRKSHCEAARGDLDRISFRESDRFERLEGDYNKECTHDFPAARAHWQRALALRPAYLEEREALARRLK